MNIHEANLTHHAWHRNAYSRVTTAATADDDDGYNDTANWSSIDFRSASETTRSRDTQNWPALLLVAMVIAGLLGNGLVCAAIGVERKLRSDTNYFLVSLAIADMFVSVVVMPCCIAQEFIGEMR